jgi:hypothetical protein
VKLHIEVDPDDPSDVEAAERTLRRLRDDATSPRELRRPQPKRRRLPTQPRHRPDELANVTPIIDATVKRDTRRKGMIEP